MKTKKIIKCPICQSTDVKTFYSRGNIPVHQNMLISTQNDAINVVKGDLKLNVCHYCGFIYNEKFDSNLLSYNSNYDNTQTYSYLFCEHIKELIHNIIIDNKIVNKNIIEIGCGDGLFIKELCKHSINGNKGIGFDPSYIGSDDVLGGSVHFEKRLYEEDCIINNEDVVVCRHVIEHVQYPMNLLKTIKNSLKDSSSSKVFIETPDVKWILKNNATLDFYYEHCSYFSIETLKYVLEKSGFKIDKILHVFNEQYIWVEASISNNKYIKKEYNDILKIIECFTKTENDIKNNWISKIKKVADKKKIAVWGAGSKGVTFVNMFDPDRKYIDCVIDINPKKDKCFIPGTGHLIVNYQEIKNREIDTIIIMNSNYKNEILGMINEMNINDVIYI